MKNETFTAERIKDEADAFFEWDGEDRSLVTTTSCLLFAQHIAGLMQARSAQPAPVVPDGYVPVPVEPTPAMLDVAVSHALMVSLSGDYNWSAYMRDVWMRMVAAAAPAQGQQVECQECERLRAEVARLRALVSYYREAESLLYAELAELKAQQVGQEPFGYLADDGGAMTAFFRAEDKDQFDAFCAEAEPLNKVALYTTPQPAPAQDVAEDWSVFIGYLIDKCEGHEISEERLQFWLRDMLDDPHYGALFRREKELAEQPSAIALSIEAAEEEHGSLRAAAKALDVDHGYLSRLKNGDKSNPSDELLAKLGLERLVIYRTAAHDKQSGEVKP